jgi:hypothetical protein
MVLRAPAWPFYRSHRPGSILMEGLGWLLKHRARPAPGVKPMPQWSA